MLMNMHIAHDVGLLIWRNKLYTLINWHGYCNYVHVIGYQYRSSRSIVLQLFNILCNLLRYLGI